MQSTIPTVDQNSTAYLDVSLFDRDDDLSVPSSIRYRILRVTDPGTKPPTETEIRAATTVTAASEFTLTLTTADNTMAGTADTEDHRVEVTAVYGASDQLETSYFYRVRRQSAEGYLQPA